MMDQKQSVGIHRGFLLSGPFLAVYSQVTIHNYDKFSPV